MTAIKPIQNLRVKGVPSTKYPVPEVSSHPHSTEKADDAHHIFPRSLIGNDSYFVLIENEDGSGTILPHVVGLTREEHRRIEEHESWIKLEDGHFVWYDRVAPTDPYDEIPEDWQEWVKIGPLNPQPGQQGTPKRKRLKGEERAQRKTISFRVPDDAERGSEVFDTLLQACKEEMVDRGLKAKPEELTTYVALTAVMGMWLQGV